jgi:hypothetical protein
MNFNARIFFIMFLGCLSVLAGWGRAEDDDESFYENRGIHDRIKLSGGGFLKLFDTNIQLTSGTNTLNPDIDLEQDLGLDTRRTDFRLDGHFRFTPRHRIEFGYLRWNREAGKFLEKDIEFGEVTFEEGTGVRTYSRMNLFKAAYVYTLINRQRFNIGLSAGASTYWSSIGIEAVANISGGNFQGERETSAVVFPVPLLGGNFEYIPVRGLIIGARGEFFWLNTATWHGDIYDVRLTLDYYPWKHIGFGTGYNWVGMNYRDENTLEELKLFYGYHGLMVYATVVF